MRDSLLQFTGFTDQTTERTKWILRHNHTFTALLPNITLDKTLWKFRKHHKTLRNFKKLLIFMKCFMKFDEARGNFLTETVNTVITWHVWTPCSGELMTPDYLMFLLLFLIRLESISVLLYVWYFSLFLLDVSKGNIWTLSHCYIHQILYWAHVINRHMMMRIKLKSFWFLTTISCWYLFPFIKVQDVYFVVSLCCWHQYSGFVSWPVCLSGLYKSSRRTSVFQHKAAVFSGFSPDTRLS